MIKDELKKWELIEQKAFSAFAIGAAILFFALSFLCIAAGFYYINDTNNCHCEHCEKMED